METQKNNKTKEISLTYKGVHHVLKFQIKRAYTVCGYILDSYPEYMDIHSLDGILNDPNRAMSDLKNDDGYANFLDERRNADRNLEYRIDLEKLFRQFPEPGVLQLGTRTRLNPSPQLKEELKKKFKMRCNITGIKLYEKLPSKRFLKNLQIIQYDHRVPLSKGGSEDPNDPANWQLLSELTNREKNKMCNSCTSIKCKECALAFPENSSIIQANGQNIEELLAIKG